MSIMEDVLMANDRVDLVFSYSADGGLGSYDAIQAAGREDEVSVIGFDASDEEQSVINEGDATREALSSSRRSWLRLLWNVWKKC